ncbi:hypothetical protein TNCV_839531 [Trichonephila clavipes]|nr:hypothetical protein TNCV_839531 [Trichonephila clavipes]
MMKGMLPKMQIGNTGKKVRVTVNERYVSECNSLSANEALKYKVTVRISSAKFPEGTIDGETTYLHLNNLDMELKGGKDSPVPCTCDSGKCSGNSEKCSVKGQGPPGAVEGW